MGRKMLQFLLDYLIAGIVIFLVGLIAHKVEDRNFRPISGSWTICFVAVTLLWPISFVAFIVGLCRIVWAYGWHRARRT